MRTIVNKRPLGQKSYRKLFVIAVEGAKTEPLKTAILKMNIVKYQ